jgi:hypothetical protein
MLGHIDAQRQIRDAPTDGVELLSGEGIDFIHLDYYHDRRGQCQCFCIDVSLLSLGHFLAMD